MPRFVCGRCRAIDNTALCETSYYFRVYSRRVEPLCTVCYGHPWHERFPRETYDPQLHGELGHDHCIVEPEPQEREGSNG